MTITSTNVAKYRVGQEVRGLAGGQVSGTVVEVRSKDGSGAGPGDITVAPFPGSPAAVAAAAVAAAGAAAGAAGGMAQSSAGGGQIYGSQYQPAATGGQDSQQHLKVQNPSRLAVAQRFQQILAPSPVDGFESSDAQIAALDPWVASGAPGRVCGMIVRAVESRILKS